MGLNPLSFLIERNKKVKRIKRIVFLVIIILIIIMTFAGTVYILNILELADIADSDSDATVYQDGDSSSTSTGIQKLLECADKIDKYMADNGFVYYPDNDPTFNNKYNEGSSKYSCCATYVSWCLQDAGMMSQHVNDAKSINDILSSNSKWKKTNVADESEMKAGDIGIYITSSGYYRHTNIYAGDSKYWDAGTTQKIQTYGKTSHSLPTYVIRYNE